MEKFSESIGAVFFTSFIAFLSWYNAYHCCKQRKFYLNNASEVQGTVASYNKWVDKSGRCNTTYYDIDVDAYNGKAYQITTTNRKARKYRKETDITLLIPDVCDSLTKDDFMERYKREIENLLLSDEEDKQKIIAETNRLYKEVLSHLGRVNKPVIIKEDLKSNAEFVLSIFFGVLFTAATAFLFYVLFIWKCI